MLEGVALKTAMTMPALLLQKPHQHSKAKDYQVCLEQRLTAWKEGDLAGLLHSKKIAEISRKGSKIKAAVCTLLCKANDGRQGQSCTATTT